MNDENTQEYIRSIQEQVMSIINGIKEEVGIDTPVEIEVREVDIDE